MKLSLPAGSVAITLSLFATVSLFALIPPLAAGAPPASKAYRIGHLSWLGAPTANDVAFREKLRELGWTEGKNITIDDRFASRHRERLTAFAAELAHMPVDLIFTTGGAESAEANPMLVFEERWRSDDHDGPDAPLLQAAEHLLQLRGTLHLRDPELHSQRSSRGLRRSPHG